MNELNREEFCLDLIRDVAGTLEDVVGLEEAEGYLAVVGTHMGRRLHDHYAALRSVETLARSDVSAVLIDLKKQIGGTFKVENETTDSITFVNDQCPFGKRVENRPSLCMMTSNVFGFISAEATGYAKVELEKTIAVGDGQCRVIVHFAKNSAPGREYYGATGL